MSVGLRCNKSFSCLIRCYLNVGQRFSGSPVNVIENFQFLLQVLKGSKEFVL